MVRRKGMKEVPKPSGRGPGRPRKERPVDAATLRTLADTLREGAAAYQTTRTTVVAAEAAAIHEVLEAVGPATAGLLCTLPERAVSPIAYSIEPYVVLIPRVHDAIVLWNDGTLALVPYGGDGGGTPVHFASAQEFVDQVGVGFVQFIATALGRELTRANARVPTLVAALDAYGVSLPRESADGEE
jgi:hypothetical protein